MQVLSFEDSNLELAERWGPLQTLFIEKQLVFEDTFVNCASALVI